MYRNAVRVCMLGALNSVPAIAAFAHHAASIHYDMSNIAEVSGRVTGVAWQNPHSVIRINVSEADGAETEWRIEAAAAAMVLRSGINRDSVSVGDNVRVAGFRGRSNTNAIFMRNLLLADGREWVASGSVEPRWTQDLASAGSMNAPTQAAGLRSGIFKVWSLDESTLPRVGPPRPLWNDSYPLTSMAREIQANWDRAADNPYVNCRNGMPAIMDTPIPMEFVRAGDDIVLRFEELDARRVIHMRESDEPAAAVAGPYGFSTGRLDGDTLIVRTVAIDWPWFDQDGIPLTENAVITERFTPSEDGRFLNYTATVLDDTVFTEAVVLDRRWVDIPDERVQAYDCSWDESDL